MTFGHESSCCASQSMIRGMATRQLPQGLATGLSMGADVTTAVPAVVGVIESRIALLLRGDGVTVSPCTNQSRGWRAGYRGTSIERLLICVAQRLLDKARQGSEAVARLRRRVLGVEEVSGAMLGAWGHPAWMRR
jgi:hypothetical protein